MFQEQIPTQEGHQLIQDLFSSNSAEQVLRQSVKVSCSSSILFGHWVIVYVKMGRTRSINSVSAREQEFGWYFCTQNFRVQL